MRARLLTTEYVLVELGDAASPWSLRSDGLAAIAALCDDPSVQIVPASTPLMQEGLDLFARRPDKDWGLADRHFEQAGFKALLRSAE